MAMEEIKDCLTALEKRVSDLLKGIDAYQPLSSCVKENDELANALYSYGYRFYENGKYNEAISCFRMLTQIDGQTPDGWTGLAASYQMLKNHGEALIAYSMAVLLDPDNPTLLFHAANCCFAEGKTVEGLKALEIAKGVAEDKPEHAAFLAQVGILEDIWSKPNAKNNKKIKIKN